MKFLKNIYILVSLLVALGLTSCEDFLNPVPETAILQEDVFTSLENAKATLIGMYDNESLYAFDGLWLPLINDLMGEDVIVNSERNYNRFLQPYQLLVSPSSSESYYPWVEGYRTINYANRILEGINGKHEGDDKIGESWELANLSGQAKVMRAYCMLHIIQLYADAYKINPDGPGALIVKNVMKLGDEDIPRSTTREVYEFIERDLLDGLADLNEYQIGFKEFGSMDDPMIQDSVAFLGIRATQAILARMYLNKGEWEKARDHAKLASDGLKLMTINDRYSGFNTPNTETIYSLKYTSTDNWTYFSLPSFYLPGGGYSSLRADTLLYNTYNAFDIRRELIPHGDDARFTYISDEGELVYLDRDNHIVLKFQNKDAKMGNAERICIRASEMKLIIAECEWELKNYSEAQDALHEVQVNAWAGAPKSSNTDELINEILLERRKELFGEGFRLNDIKRRNLPLYRSGHHWYLQDIEPGDENYYRFTLPLPQHEIDSNTALTSSDQNKGY